MILCVGAASRIVVEEAAKLRVHQIVASRRQVGEFAPGYTGLSSPSLVALVQKLSGDNTNVVRDHGGPYQNGDKNDNWEAAFDADVDAGFNALHIDVCKLPEEEQRGELRRLCRKYANSINIEIGGERDSQQHLFELLSVALRECAPSVAVADFGGRIWADKQYGSLIKPSRARDIIAEYSSMGVGTKLHNCDWIGGRQDYVGAALYNIAPELGNVEIDAWLRTVDGKDATRLLGFAYGTGAWRRWFNEGEGTKFERSRAALRYLLTSDRVAGLLSKYDDAPVREAVRDAIAAG